MSILSLNTGTIAHYMPEGTDVQENVRLNSLKDVSLATLANGQILQYNSSTAKWENLDPANLPVGEIDGGTY
jgi:hypothetical protein